MLGCTQELALLTQASPNPSPTLPPLPRASLPGALQLQHHSALLSSSAVSSSSFHSQCQGSPAQPSTCGTFSPGPRTLRASSPCCTHVAGPALARSQLQSRSYLTLIKNIPGWKEPKGHFLPAAPGWRGSEGCRSRPAQCAAHRRLRPRPDRGSSAPWSLFLAPVKRRGSSAQAGAQLHPRV